MDDFVTLFVLALCSVITVTYSVNCFGRRNGNYMRDCKTFTKCSNGIPVVMRCADYTAFNQETNRCEYIFNIPPPCGAYRECSRLKDGAYPDIAQKCMTFYLCINHQLIMDAFCPTGLVFNVGNQVCDWPFNVTEPCGIL